MAIQRRCAFHPHFGYRVTSASPLKFAGYSENVGLFSVVYKLRFQNSNIQKISLNHRHQQAYNATMNGMTTSCCGVPRYDM